VIGRARLLNGLTGLAEMKDFPKPIAGYAGTCAEPWPMTELRLGAFVIMVASSVAERPVARRTSTGNSGASPHPLPITNH
jgi:hypothetical protein